MTQNATRQTTQPGNTGRAGPARATRMPGFAIIAAVRLITGQSAGILYILQDF